MTTQVDVTTGPSGRRWIARRDQFAINSRRPDLWDAGRTEREFCAAIRAAGIDPPDAIKIDGRIHRFPTNDRRGDDAGWYVCHGGSIPAGAFGDWRTGVSDKWCAEIGRALTESERSELREKRAAILRAREADDLRRRERAAAEAAAIWGSASPASSAHPYLVRKGVGTHGIREDRGELLVPLGEGNRMHSLQTIAADGTKRFHVGGRISGCWFAIGECAAASVICIAEGFATGATVHEATGFPVAVAFNAGNLEPVAHALRECAPHALIVLCADDDAGTASNPGVSKAKAAARRVGGTVVIPDFGPDRPNGASDFNDMAAHRGIAAVREAIRGVVERLQARGTAQAAIADVSDVTDVRASNDAADDATRRDHGDAHGVTDSDRFSVPAENRPCFKVWDNWLVSESGGRLRPGVWYFGIKASRGDEPPALTQKWVCSPIHVEAVTHDGQEGNFGRLLRFRNTLGRWREWAMPMELLRASGDDLRGELLAMGVQIDPSAHRLLGQYLQANTPQRRMLCALQVGWCNGSFVLPDEVIGPQASEVIFQSGERGCGEYGRDGSLGKWRDEIAARAPGNPLLMLALCGAFAGPLLDPTNSEGGGLHFVGDSSTGKTTLIEAACSVWGGPNFRRSWRATANGMEGAAMMFNDGMLALDEISECDPREVGAIIYALGNGRGKQRADRRGYARSLTRWRVVVLSSGERAIATAMEEGGQRAKAGQSVRLLDIPAARSHGAFDALGTCATGAALADAIKRAAKSSHGHAGRAFLERLTADARDLSAMLEAIKGDARFADPGIEGQNKRAAARFALFALAGELASEYGVTGWPSGAATDAAAVGFTIWLSQRGAGNDERRQIVDRVASFIDRHGDGRFSDCDGDQGNLIRDRAGWWRDESGGRVYLFNADGLREALRGFDFKRALDVLQTVGALPPAAASGERAKPQRIGGRVVRVYPIHHERLAGGSHAM